jgi:hypothetical protein
MINIIHLGGTEWSDERYLSFTKELFEQNIANYKIWDGIHDANRVRAINRAHKQIIQYAKESGLREICVMEDDCIFLHDGAFNYYLENKPQNFDIYMGGISNKLRVEDDYITDFRGMTLYTVHESFYDKFLSVPETVNIDAGLKGLGKYYLCKKVVCSQRAGFSYHKKRHKDYSHLLNQYETFNGEV